MIRRLLIPVALVGALAACGGGDDDTAAGDGAAAPTTTSAEPAPPADEPAGSGDAAGAIPEALQFSAPLIGGGEIEMGELAGRPVLLWFWAPW